jgi:uncharacterized protein YdcH (DUF465 family)
MMKHKLIAHLTLAHTGLDMEIAEESKRRFPNPVHLARLKKLKLKIKDKLQRLLQDRRRAGYPVAHVL